MMSAVGDAVHVLPVINALKRQSPNVHVTWVLQPGPASLVRGHRSVDEIILFDRAKGWSAFADVRRTLRQSLRTGGDPSVLARRRRRVVPRRLVML